jgi:hypothetical protein
MQSSGCACDGARDDPIGWLTDKQDKPTEQGRPTMAAKIDLEISVGQSGPFGSTCIALPSRRVVFTAVPTLVDE